MSQPDYTNLIHKQLSGEITDQELLDLNTWVNASEANKSEAEAIRFLWENAEFDAATMVILDDVDLDAEFDLLNQRIHSEQEEEIKVIPIQRRRFWAVAASIAVIIGVTVSLFFMSDSVKTEIAEIKTGEVGQEILLADGSTVFLNANSTLKYPIEFNGDTREVEMTGEGFFEIAKDPRHPFTVHTPYEDVTVLGTSFNVRAFDDEANSEVAVTTGKVQVSSSVTNIVLTPNQKVLVDHSSGVMNSSESKSLNESAWHTGVMTFDNAPAVEVIEDLESFFDVTINYDPSLENCTGFKSTFKDQDLKDISVPLKSFSKVFGVDFQKSGNGNYTIIGEGTCQ